MMILINRQGDTITGSCNGKAFGVTFDEKKYALMKEIEAKSQTVETVAEMQALIEEFTPLTKESYKEVVESVTPFLHVNKHTNKYYLKYNNVVSSKALPAILVEKILTSVEKQIDINPLIKCWVRFLRNPNYTDSKAKLFAEYITAPYTDKAHVSKLMAEEGLSEEMALALATRTQVAITLEGLLVGYKVSTEILTRYDLNENEEVVEKSRYKKSVDPDTGVITFEEPEHVEDRLFEPYVMGNSGDEFWCVGNQHNKKGHHIRVGCSHFLDSWSQVNCNDGVSGVKGLHVGGLNYISGFQDNGVTHNVLIDPADIGAIVGLGYGNDGAMRVRRYFVHSSFAGVNKNIYHSSKYAAMNDTEYMKALEEVVTKTQQKKAALDKQIDEANALTN